MKSTWKAATRLVACLAALAGCTGFGGAATGCAAAGDQTDASLGAAGSGAANAAGTGVGSSGGTMTGAGGGFTTVGSGQGSGGGASGCTFVDLLFVIDSSSSMGSYQSALAQTFPQFVDSIIQNLPPDTDLHVGITTSDFSDTSQGSPGEGNCMTLGTAADFIPNYITPDKGNTGDNGGQGRLYQWQGKPYFASNTSDDPTPLKTWFTGAAIDVGEAGSVFEMVAAGAAYAAHPANDATNAGFIRDEGALLVIFFLTDEVDNSILETVDTYHSMVVNKKSKCGGDACILTGGIIPPCIASTPGNTLWGLMSSFGEPNPPFADIDGPPAAYAGALGDALAQVIAQTCDEIPPPPN
jgi:hypothetical protein